jgi:hypothetical protein
MLSSALNDVQHLLRLTLQSKSPWATRAEIGGQVAISVPALLYRDAASLPCSSSKYLVKRKQLAYLAVFVYAPRHWKVRSPFTHSIRCLFTPFTRYNRSRTYFGRFLLIGPHFRKGMWAFSLPTLRFVV